MSLSARVSAPELAPVFVALYLRGLARPTNPYPRRWPHVEALLLREMPAFSPETLSSHASRLYDLLLKHGLWPEAAALDAMLPVAIDLLAEGRVLTALDACYPRRWRHILGAAAPPALYLEGDPHLLRLPSVTVVGSRSLSEWHASFASAAGSAVRDSVLLVPAKQESQNGAALVSGGAPGADTLAEQAAKGPVIEIAPAGLRSWRSPIPPSNTLVRLSLWPPDAPFTAAAAMERNTLLYAYSPVTVLAHARFKQGGSWHGATEALRKRLTHLLVPGDNDLAHRALAALGAQTVSSPEQLPAILAAAMSTALLGPVHHQHGKHLREIGESPFALLAQGPPDLPGLVPLYEPAKPMQPLLQ